jgi:hypothetical protein
VEVEADEGRGGELHGARVRFLDWFVLREALELLALSVRLAPNGSGTYRRTEPAPRGQGS